MSGKKLNEQDFVSGGWRNQAAVVRSSPWGLLELNQVNRVGEAAGLDASAES